MASKKKLNQSKVKRFLKIFGPGLVTGASDDDPSGILLMSVAAGILLYFQFTA